MIPLSERLFACFLLACVWPILLVAWARRTLLLRKSALVAPVCVRGPSPRAPPEPRVFHRLLLRKLPGHTGPLEHCITEALPGLVHAALGDMRLIGPPSRTPSEVEGLSPEWRRDYARWQPGLICEGSGDRPWMSSSEQRHFEEVLTVEAYGPADRRALLWRYASSVVADMGVALRDQVWVRIG